MCWVPYGPLAAGRVGPNKDDAASPHGDRDVHRARIRSQEKPRPFQQGGQDVEAGSAGASKAWPPERATISSAICLLAVAGPCHERRQLVLLSQVAGHAAVAFRRPSFGSPARTRIDHIIRVHQVTRPADLEAGCRRPTPSPADQIGPTTAVSMGRRSTPAVILTSDRASARNGTHQDIVRARVRALRPPWQRIPDGGEHPTARRTEHSWSDSGGRASPAERAPAVGGESARIARGDRRHRRSNTIKFVEGRVPLQQLVRRRFDDPGQSRPGKSVANGVQQG